MARDLSGRIGEYVAMTTMGETVRAYLPPPLPQPTVQKSLEHLEELGIVREITGKLRSRLYEYASYLKILDEGN